MNMALYLCCHMVLASAPASSDTVAVVDLHECLRHAAAFREHRGTIQKDIEITDRLAKAKIEAVQAAEGLLNDDSSAAERDAAARLRAEFELFRLSSIRS